MSNSAGRPQDEDDDQDDADDPDAAIAVAVARPPWCAGVEMRPDAAEQDDDQDDDEDQTKRAHSRSFLLRPSQCATTAPNAAIKPPTAPEVISSLGMV